MVKQYAFLWHVIASEEAAAALCESAETETPSQDETYAKLEQWLGERISACTAIDCSCKAGGIITEEISWKMIASGMIEHLVKI